jgi:hypothetical protein
VCALLTHRAVSRWDQAAFHEIVTARVHAHKAVGDPLARFIRSTLARSLDAIPRELAKPGEELSFTKSGSLPVQDLFARARDLQAKTDPEVAGIHIGARKNVQPDLLPSRIDRRIVLLADLTADLAVVKQSEEIRGEVARFLTASAASAPEYRPLRLRTASLTAFNAEDRLGSVGYVNEGVKALESMRDDEDVTVDEISIREVEHQLVLRQAGNVVQSVEDMFAAGNADIDPAVVVGSVRAMLFWAGQATKALAELEQLDAL